MKSATELTGLVNHNREARDARPRLFQKLNFRVRVYGSMQYIFIIVSAGRTSGSSSSVLLQLQSSVLSFPSPSLAPSRPLTNEGVPPPFFTVPTATALRSNKTEKGMKGGEEGKEGADETNECPISLCIAC